MSNIPQYASGPQGKKLGFTDRFLKMYDSFHKREGRVKAVFRVSHNLTRGRNTGGFGVKRATRLRNLTFCPDICQKMRPMQRGKD
jgi:hypothetical protein